MEGDLKYIATNWSSFISAVHLMEPLTRFIYYRITLNEERSCLEYFKHIGCCPRLVFTCLNRYVLSKSHSLLLLFCPFVL